MRKNLDLIEFLKVFTNPDKIIDYSKESWNFWKHSLIIIIAGLFFGFNFIFSNFIFSIVPQMYLYIFLMCSSGIFVLSIFLGIYLGIIYIAIRLSLQGNIENLSRNETLTNEMIEKDVGVSSDKQIITRKNIRDWLSIFSSCFLIPFLIFNIIEFSSTVLFINLNMYYVIVYIKDYGKYLLYAWIISLTLYSTEMLEPNQKYQMRILLLCSYITAYAITGIINFQGAHFIIKVIMPAL